jgi:hypothetical protein
MVVQNLQSLVLRAASFAGACANGQGSKYLRATTDGNPARVLSLLWHPLPGLETVGTEPAEAHRTLTMDGLGRRAGRSASSAGVPGQIGSARLPGGTILLGWCSTRPGTADAVHATGKRGPSRFASSPMPVESRRPGYPQVYYAAMREAIA